VDRLHTRIVRKLPLVLRGDVLVVEVPAAALGPADGLGLREPPEEHGVVAKELEAKVEERGVESEAETPPNLHFYYFVFKIIIIFS